MQRADGEEALPDQVLVTVLDLLAGGRTVAAAALVNKRWLRVATSKDLWCTKMAPALSSCCGGPPACSWGHLFFAIYRTNLLANPYLAPPLPAAGASVAPPGSWVVTSEGGSGWAWEAEPDWGEPCSPEAGCHVAAVPASCPPFFGKAGRPHAPQAACAVASSYRWCELVQTVDLLAELARRGLSPEAAAAFLDSCPPLSFSVWYAGRTDCPAECEARVVLTGADAYTPAHAAAAAADAAPHLGDAGRRPPHLANSAARKWGWTTGCVQTGKGCWQRAMCVLAGYPPGVRHATVVLRGRDLRFWRGHYGAKLAAPSLRFMAPAELEALGAPEE